jgi:hypothetical protein
MKARLESNKHSCNAKLHLYFGKTCLFHASNIVSPQCGEFEVPIGVAAISSHELQIQSRAGHFYFLERL